MADPTVHEEPQKEAEPADEEKEIATASEEDAEVAPEEEIKDQEKAIHFQGKAKEKSKERFERIYAESNEYRRVAEALGYKPGDKRLHEVIKQQLDETKSDVELLKKHNEQLAKALEAREEAKRDSAIVQERTTEHQRLASLKAAKKAAIAAVDYEKAFELEDQITELVLDMARPKPEEIAKIATTATSQNDANALVEEFKAETEWFEPIGSDGKQNPKYDVAKRGMAIALEQELLPGWKRSYRELLKEVRKRVDDRFTEKKTVPQTPIAGVAGVTPRATPVSASVINLTADEKRVVRMMFGDDPDGEKKYADQLKAMGRR